MSENILNFIHITLSVLIIVLVMLQAKESGFSTVFGGGSFQTERRGAEKHLHRFTIILVLSFIVFSILRVVYF